MTTRKLWAGLAALLAVSFAALLWVGSEIHRQMPPLPAQVVTDNGDLVLTREDIQTGRQVWQSIGGHQLGSIWGHGSYVAPDWTADWLQREARAWLDLMAREGGAEGYDAVDAEVQASLRARLQARMRVNGYDAATDTLVIPAARAEALAQVRRHYTDLFGDEPALLDLRRGYAMKNGTVADPEHREKLAAFVWWTAWSAVTPRPGQTMTYTANWPYDPLVGNEPPPHLLMWTVFSVLFLIAGIGLLGWYYARQNEGPLPDPPKIDPLSLITVTPSMKATAKYFWVVIALFWRRSCWAR